MFKEYAWFHTERLEELIRPLKWFGKNAPAVNEIFDVVERHKRCHYNLYTECAAGDGVEILTCEDICRFQRSFDDALRFVRRQTEDILVRKESILEYGNMYRKFSCQDAIKVSGVRDQANCMAFLELEDPIEAFFKR